MRLFRRCNHKWKIHSDVTATYTGVGLLNKGHKVVERKQVLICTECGKIEHLTLG